MSEARCQQCGGPLWPEYGTDYCAACENRKIREVLDSEQPTAEFWDASSIANPNAAQLQALDESNKKLAADLAAAQRRVRQLERLAADVCALNGDDDQLQSAIHELGRAIGYPGY